MGSEPRVLWYSEKYGINAKKIEVSVGKAEEAGTRKKKAGGIIVALSC